MRDDRIEHHVTTIGNHETPEKNSLNEQVHGLVERLKLVMRYIYILQVLQGNVIGVSYY